MLLQVSLFTLPVHPTFSLSARICSYGYFRLAPNHWVPAVSGKYDEFFYRPFRYGPHDTLVAYLSIHQPVGPVPWGQLVAVPRVQEKMTMEEDEKRCKQAGNGPNSIEDNKIEIRLLDPSLLPRFADSTKSIPSSVATLTTSFSSSSLSTFRTQISRMLHVDFDPSTWYTYSNKIARCSIVTWDGLFTLCLFPGFQVCIASCCRSASFWTSISITHNLGGCDENSNQL